MNITTTAKFHNNHITIISQPTNLTKREKSESELKNLEKGKNGDYNGYMSRGTEKKCKEIMTSWLNSVTEKRKAQLKNKKGGKALITTFVTLTLCSKQAHDDNYIKRNMLNRFLITLKNLCKVSSYFWRAEPQKNGNIHFHIVLDKFIRHEFIRQEWNKILDDNGYISEFRKKHGHSNPNSTDIHALKHITNGIAYICKYTCKKSDVENTRKIEGRIWGCSDNIRDLKVFKVQLQETQDRILVYKDEKFVSLVSRLEKECKKIKVVFLDYGKVLCSKEPIFSFIKKVDKEIAEVIQDYYLKLEY